MAVLAVSCSPRVGVSLYREMPPTDPSAPVLVFGIGDPRPPGAEVIGTVSVGDSGLTIQCDFQTVLGIAKDRTRKAGGNAVGIISHKTPSFASTCHRIEAEMLYVPDTGPANISTPEEAIDRDLLQEGCAVIHFYRFGGIGTAVSYDVKTENEIVCRVAPNSRQSFKVKALGETTFTAATEATAYLTFDVLPGYHYYVQCGLEMGAFVGRPTIELVDGYYGKLEFDSIKE